MEGSRDSVRHCSLSVCLTVLLHCLDRISHGPSLSLSLYLIKYLRWCTALGRKLLSSCVALRLASIKQSCVAFVPEIRKYHQNPADTHTQTLPTIRVNP